MTTDPNPLVTPIQPKVMPVLLDEQDEKRWLTCSFERAVALAKPFPSQLMGMAQATSQLTRDNEKSGSEL